MENQQLLIQMPVSDYLTHVEACQELKISRGFFSNLINHHPHFVRHKEEYCQDGIMFKGRQRKVITREGVAALTRIMNSLSHYDYQLYSPQRY